METSSAILERIKRLRSILLVHSYIYYRLCTSLISDDEWQAAADELTRLQAHGPISIGFYDEAFKDWDGTTGFHLPQDHWVAGKAHYLLYLHEKGVGKTTL